jgi:hypothetical protein
MFEKSRLAGNGLDRHRLGTGRPASLAGGFPWPRPPGMILPAAKSGNPARWARILGYGGAQTVLGHRPVGVSLPRAGTGSGLQPSVVGVRLCTIEQQAPREKLMSTQIELSAERLMKLEPEIRAALAALPNEADTRLKVLDRFLFEILDWHRDSSVETEPPTESGYIDYLLKIGENRGAMVVEAKRKGKLDRRPSRVTFCTSPSRVP